MKKFAIIIVSIFIAINFIGCGGKTGTKEETSGKKTSSKQKEVEEVNFDDFSAKKRFEEALEIAREWQGDAEVYSMSVFYAFQKGEQFLKPTVLTYSFGSPQVKEGGLVVFTEGGELLNAFDENIIVIGFLDPLDLTRWNIDNNEVIESAEEAGGRNFRLRENPDELGITLTGGSELIWGVNYYFKPAKIGSLSGFKIDPENGQVIEEF